MLNTQSMRAFMVALTGAAVALLLPADAHAIASAASPTQLYTQALETMSALPQPRFMSFTTSVSAHGMNVALVQGKGTASNRAGFEIGFGASGLMPTTMWKAIHRAADDRTVVFKDSTPLIVTSPMYDPTWQGADDWLRYGIRGGLSPLNSTPVATPRPNTAVLTPAQATPNGLKTIATLTVMAPGAYEITDAGPGTCPNGSAGNRLHLVARRDPDGHPLTDVVLDSSTNRFCTMRFNVGHGGLMSLTGSFELHFGEVNGYWIIKDGVAQFLLRTFGFGAKNATITFDYQDISYPKSVPDSMFPS